MRGTLIILAALALATLATPATAVPGQWTVQGFVWYLSPKTGQEVVPEHGLSLMLDADAPSGYGIVSLELPPGLAVANITELAFDMYFTFIGGCGGGSPRMQLHVDRDGDGVADKNVFVYAGPGPNFNNCQPAKWLHADLRDGALRWDSTQLGGPFYGTQAQAHALAGATHQVVRATLVWDSAWMFPETVTWVDNLRVNAFYLDEPVTGTACSLVVGQGLSC